MTPWQVWLAMPRHRLAALATLLGAGTVLAGIGLMVTAAYLIARTAERPPILDLMIVFVVVRFFGLARPALRYADRIVSHDVTFRLLHDVRGWFIAALLPLAPARLVEFRSGDLLARLASDVDSLRDVHLRLVAPALIALAVGGIVVTSVALVDRRLALAVLVLLLANGVAWPWLTRKATTGLGRQRNLLRAAMSARLVPMLQGLADLLTLGGEARELAKVMHQQAQVAAIDRREATVLAWQAAAAAITAQLAWWAALLLLVPRAINGEIAGIWVAVLALGIIAAFESVEGLPAAWQAYEPVADASLRVWQVIDAKPCVADPTIAEQAAFAATPSSASAGRLPAIRLSGVTFRYDARVVLNGVRLDVAPGEHVAIVGSSGSGKSTLLALVARVWDPSQGTVEVMGVNARHVALDQVRATMAVMPQQVHIFDDTLRENLRLTAPAATDADLARVIGWARLGTLVASLPDGLETRVGERGSRLSAGERQRLGLARLMLSDAPLVLVDEPTAHLDAETERDVLCTLRDWAHGRAMLLVTHRPAGLEGMDRILRLDAGVLTSA